MFNLLLCNWLKVWWGTMLARKRNYRKQTRRPMHRGAAVVLQAAWTPVRCVVWDISDGGARLAISYPTAELPRSFTLLLTKDASVRRNCEVVWVDERFVGVRFVSDSVSPHGQSFLQQQATSRASLPAVGERC